VEGIRAAQSGSGGVDALLNEFALSTEEGIVLMCLAEALLRVPDKLTIDRLIRDKLLAGNWGSHLGNSDSLFVNASAWGLLLTGKVVSYSDEDRDIKQTHRIGLLKKTVNRLGEPVIRTAVRYAMQSMGTHSVMGKTIDSAIERAQKQEARGYRYSYDMLGEGARTLEDADRHYQDYHNAILEIGRAAEGRDCIQSPGISIKLSAIHPRFELSQRNRVFNELVPRLKALACAARQVDIGFTVDAEEADRLELTLDVIEAVFTDPDLSGWEGFGLVVQTYQKRAPVVIEWAAELSRSVGRKLMVRLVKGAYWDSEIKWSQAGGCVDYPVFTRKPATDLCFQACARQLLAARDTLYPQFATHNAYAVASILELDRESPQNFRQGYEFQRLHGMGEALYDQVLEREKVPCRIYAPVGEHADLLAYLVRRLLENGSNTSFVNNIVDERVAVESLLEDPVVTVRNWTATRNASIPLPPDLYLDAPTESGRRENALGIDLHDKFELEAMAVAMDAWWQEWRQKWRLEQGLPGAQSLGVFNPADHREQVGVLQLDDPASMLAKLALVDAAQPGWEALGAGHRADLLRKLAGRLENERYQLMGLCIKEAGKTIPDAVAELREAIDFCRYYADRVIDLKNAPARGVVLCISPWNFPLAIFLGQVCAALVCGNTVVAKPAEQTSLVAHRILDLMAECGFPEDVLALVCGPGQPVGETLVPDSRVRAVMFTGSTGTGSWLARTLAEREDIDIPLIAETGGQNAMIVDSTALPEQVVDDVILSGFHSAGQRCSALRVLFLQEDIADKVTTMICGAMAEMSIGNPADLATDVGPVIDRPALDRLEGHSAYIASLGERARLVYQCEVPANCENGDFFPPKLYELEDVALLHQEVFGPVVHIVRYRAHELDKVVDQINDLGFGLTLGVHSRIQTVAARIASRARVGNVYINRNMIGAIVGVQPFGGRGLSGTGPKAGGPHYLGRLVTKGELGTRREEPALDYFLGDQLPGVDSLTRADVARIDWSGFTVTQRGAIFRRLCATLAQNAVGDWVGDLSAGVEALIAASEPLQDSVTLPGPTGELNQLLLEPRGLVTTFVNNPVVSVPDILRQLSALMAGNGILVLVDQHNEAEYRRCAQALENAGLPPHLYTVLEQATARVVLADRRVAAVVIEPGSAWVRPVRRQLVERDDAIVPLVLESEPRQLLHRLVVEKTLSIDTTAAGGNASLMTMSDG
jgi:RHH-type proline utilization regulon transcriptional repressor/proline dehydrogenase/delta 1-pyrroline-5-carboxylate dehydrogenase